VITSRKSILSWSSKRRWKAWAEGAASRMDVRAHDSIQRMAEAAHHHYGKIDILVNNAAAMSANRRGCDLGGLSLWWIPTCGRLFRRSGSGKG